MDNNKLILSSTVVFTLTIEGMDDIKKEGIIKYENADALKQGIAQFLVQYGTLGILLGEDKDEGEFIPAHRITSIKFSVSRVARV